MVAAQEQNDDELVVGLARWLAGHWGLSKPRVVDVRRPSAGYSSETVLVEAAWTDGDGEHRLPLVVRMAPPATGTFPRFDLEAQAQAQVAAAAVGVPVADPVLETDARWVGAPFILMPRVDGHIVGSRGPSRPVAGHLEHRPAGGGVRRHAHHPGRRAPLRPLRCPRRPTTGPRGRVGLLGAVPGLVERRPPGPRAGRRPGLVPGTPSGRRVRPRPPVGRRAASRTWRSATIWPPGPCWTGT